MHSVVFYWLCVSVIASQIKRHKGGMPYGFSGTLVVCFGTPDLSSPACGLFTDQCYEIALKKESSCVIS